MEALSPGEQQLIQLARDVGLLGSDVTPPETLVLYALAIVQAYAQIGDGYWQDYASAGQHIRAAFYP